jgi:hypothetical protein
MNHVDLEAALDAIWQSSPPQRQQVARRQLANLDTSAVDLLTVWDYQASVEQETGNQSLHQSMTQPGTPVVHSLVSLLLAAQYARDHLDALLFSTPEERNRRIADLGNEWGIPEAQLRRLFASFAAVIQQAST